MTGTTDTRSDLEQYYPVEMQYTVDLINKKKSNSLIEKSTKLFEMN